MQIIENAVRRKIESDQVAIGLRVHHMRGPQISLIARAADYDFLFIDLEHSAMTIDQAADMCIASLSVGVAPIVRCAKAALDEGIRLLDNGAMGLVIPHVNTRAEAEAIVQACRFPPTGHRSWAGVQPLFGYVNPPTAEAQPALDREILVIPMIESPEAVANAAEIAAVPGVDMLMIGVSDLSTTMGIPGQPGHPDIRTAFEKVAAACQANGVWLGMGGVKDDLAQTSELIALGVRFIMVGGDHDCLLAGARAISKTTRQAEALARQA